jgi:hypothetical protein
VFFGHTAPGVLPAQPVFLAVNPGAHQAVAVLPGVNLMDQFQQYVINKITNYKA